MTHEKAHWDPETKTLFVETISDRSDPKRKTSFWDEDPQLQIINLLKAQNELLKKILAQTAPYHTGSQTVQISDSGTVSPDSDSNTP